MAEVNKTRRLKDISPREVYDAATQVVKREGRLTQVSVGKELKMGSGFSGVFTQGHDWSKRLKFAYEAVHRHLPYPSELDDPDYDPWSGPPWKIAEQK